RAPLGGHIRNRKPRVHRERGHSRPRKLDRRIQAFIMVIKSAQSNNDVFACRSRSKLALQHDLNRPRNLPPEFARRPHRSCIRAYDRRTDCPQRAIHIGVRIRCHYERSGKNISALHHNLVADARARRVKIHAMLLGERFDGAVLFLVRLDLILNIVIQREHHLPRIFQFLRPDTLELAHDRRSVVVRHAAMRPDRQEIPRPQRPFRPFRHVRLCNFLNNRLTHTDLSSSSSTRNSNTSSAQCDGADALHIAAPSRTVSSPRRLFRSKQPTIRPLTGFESSAPPSPPHHRTPSAPLLLTGAALPKTPADDHVHSQSVQFVRRCSNSNFPSDGARGAQSRCQTKTASPRIAPRSKVSPVRGPRPRVSCTAPPGSMQSFRWDQPFSLSRALAPMPPWSPCPLWLSLFGLSFWLRRLLLHVGLHQRHQFRNRRSLFQIPDRRDQPVLCLLRQHAFRQCA